MTCHRRRAAVAAALVLGLAPPLASLAHQPASSRRAEPVAGTAARLPVIRESPDFTLIDQEGHRLRLADLRGRVVLISFVYLSCPGACPLITQRMAVLYQQLIRARLVPEQVRLLSITVDPQRDDRPALARYARSIGADGPGWRFLRDSPQHLRPVLAAFDEWAKPLPDGKVDHPARLHLVDGRRRVREIYSVGFFDPSQALIDIEGLLQE
jgi:protein SCO1